MKLKELESLMQVQAAAAWRTWLVHGAAAAAAAATAAACTGRPHLSGPLAWVLLRAGHSTIRKSEDRSGAVPNRAAPGLTPAVCGKCAPLWPRLLAPYTLRQLAGRGRAGRKCHPDMCSVRLLRESRGANPCSCNTHDVAGSPSLAFLLHRRWPTATTSSTGRQ